MMSQPFRLPELSKRRIRSSSVPCLNRSDCCLFISSSSQSIGDGESNARPIGCQQEWNFYPQITQIICVICGSVLCGLRKPHSSVGAAAVNCHKKAQKAQSEFLELK